MPLKPRFLVLPLAFALFSAAPALAGWPQNSTTNVPLTTASGDQSYVDGRSDVMIPDGAGGAFIVWHDLGFESGSEVGVFIQRVLADGSRPWGANGVAICTLDSFQVIPAVIADGAGGAILAWTDHRGLTFDIYAQRVNGSGVPQWAANGLPVSTAVGDQTVPAILADGTGGAILAWSDTRNGATSDIYAQRINGSGVRQWSLSDIALCTAAGDQGDTRIVSDGAGGAVVSWYDFRVGTTNSDIYARRITAAGAPQWTANGVALCTAIGNQRDARMVSDGAGGAIVAWYDERGGSGNSDIYAQRVAAAGTVSWAANGVAACVAVGSQYAPALVTDGAGGAIVVWGDPRSGQYDIYAQRMSGGGVAQWTANGVAVCTAANGQYTPSITADGSGGAIFAWEDARGATSDIYAQRVNTSGSPQWTANGVAVSSAIGGQFSPVVVTDLAGGGVVAWQDDRNGNVDIYAQEVDLDGFPGGPPPDLTIPGIDDVADVPNDQGGKVMVRWRPSSLDTAPSYAIGSYTLWRRIITTTSPIPIEDSGRFLVTSVGGTQATYWEFVATVPANAAPGYAYMATTGSDSLPGLIPWNVFFVQAKAAASNTYYTSPVDSGYSVDNLSPGAPGSFAGAVAGGVTHLHWNPNGEGDLFGYRLYRGVSQGFVPGPGNLVAAPPDTVYSDAATGYYYKLSAVDVHGNESPYALLSPQQTTDVGEGAPSILSLSIASSNPARSQVSLRYTLPNSGSLRLTVYDIAGRMVRALESGARPTGSYAARWDGRDGAGRLVGSGMYVLRLEASGRSVAARCLLLR